MSKRGGRRLQNCRVCLATCLGSVHMPRDSFSASGWAFASASGPIDGTPQLLALGRRLSDPYSPGDAQITPFCVHGATRSLKPCMCGSALVMGVRMHLPEAVFGGNRLVLTHIDSGFRIAFTAEGALKCWARDSVVGDHVTARVAPAELPVWRQRMLASTLRTSTAVDWTFCCAQYGGDAAGLVDDASATDEPCTSCTTAQMPSLPPPAMVMSGLVGLQSVTASGQRPKRETSASGDEACAEVATGHHEEAWRPHDGPGLDMQLLTKREQILWSADLPLYEDMLHDHGVSSLRVRVRVMPSCFLVLLRHNLRIDGVLIQQKEVRIFHKFGSDVVLRSHRTARKALPPLPSAMAMRAGAEQHTALRNSETKLPSRMPPPTTAMPPPTTAIPPPTTVAPSTLHPSALKLPAPRSGPGPMRGVPPDDLVLSHRVTLDEQRIAQILQACDADEHTEEICLTPPATPSVDLSDATSALTLEQADESTVDVVSPTPLEPVMLAAPPMTAPLSTLTVCDGVDACWLVGGATDGTLILLRLNPTTDEDALASEAWRVRRAHRGAILGALVPPGGDCVLSCGEDGSCAEWAQVAAEDQEPRRRWNLDCKSADRVHYFDEEAGDARRSRQSFAVVQLIAAEPESGSLRFAAAVGASVFLLDRTMDAPWRKLGAGCTVTALEYVQARRLLCAAGYGGVRLWADYGAGDHSTLVYKGPLDTLAISPDVRYAACGAQDSTLVLWPLSRPEAPELPSADAAPPPTSLGSPADGATVSQGVQPTALGMPRIGSEAEAALHSGSALFFGGSYDQKVGPLAWDGGGRLCASAGGRRVVVWDMEAPGAPPPVRRNGRATLIRSHGATVTWLGFQPDGQATLGSASSDGRILLHAIRSSAGGMDEPTAASARAELLDKPVAASAAGAAARESPMAWAPGGWLFFSTRSRQLAAVRSPVPRRAAAATQARSDAEVVPVD